MTSDRCLRILAPALAAGLIITIFFWNSSGIMSSQRSDRALLAVYSAQASALLVLVLAGAVAAAGQPPSNKKDQLCQSVPAEDEFLAANVRVLQHWACEANSAHPPHTFELLIVPARISQEMCAEFLAALPKNIAVARYLLPDDSSHDRFVMWQTPRTKDLGDLPNVIDRLTAHGAVHHIGGRDVLDTYQWLMMQLDSFNE